jgi:hypothetical protein
MIADESATELEIKYGRGFRSGDLVILQSKRPLTQTEFTRLWDSLQLVTADTGVKFLFVEHFLEVVEREPDAGDA